jgi:site-specific DNA-methyltransferase (adenine-specific)/adenine-specific DNA-methyltransferase
MSDASGTLRDVMLTVEQRAEIVRILERGEDLSAEWARVLFPPERREYELSYHGKAREEDVVAETLAVPLQPVRTFGGGNSASLGWQNMLIFGDNLQVMKALLEQKRAGTLASSDGTPGARLVYIDPPFATMQDFRGTDQERAYQDKIAGARFIEFLRKRLVLIYELMADDSSLYVHLDTKKSHYMKVVLDEIFGEHAFRAEIMWKRTNARKVERGWPRVHDVIFMYNRGNGSRFTPLMVKADKDKLPHTLITLDGKKYQTYELTGAGVTAVGESGKPWRGFNPGSMGRHWANSLEDRESWYRDGLIHMPDGGGFPRRRDAAPFDPDAREVPVSDVWTDIDRINQAAKERTGYPTQKPELLLERIVNASSQPGDLVLDAFAGSGTTCVVAEKLGRRWISIDCGKLAIYSIQKRLLNLRADIGHRGEQSKATPFTLYNAGLYDFSKLRELPWSSWRFFALQLFQCKDEQHVIGGVKLDGKLKNGSVLVFNHLDQPGVAIDEETIQSLHQSLRNKVGPRFFIIAPALAFNFQQDYIQLDSVRYYALRIPYSVINELHQREFTALKQPSDELAVNDTVEAVGFDFVRTPDLVFECKTQRRPGELLNDGVLTIATFRSDAAIRAPLVRRGNLETLSMVMVDFAYDETTKIFDLDEVYYAEDIAKREWSLHFPLERLGSMAMFVFIDIYGNEARVLISPEQFKGEAKRGATAVTHDVPVKAGKIIRRTPLKQRTPLQRKAGTAVSKVGSRLHSGSLKRKRK